MFTSRTLIRSGVLKEISPFNLLNPRSGWISYGSRSSLYFERKQFKSTQKTKKYHKKTTNSVNSKEVDQKKKKRKIEDYEELVMNSDDENLPSELIPDRTDDLLRTNIIRYEQAFALQQKGDNYMKEDNYEKAAEAYESCIGSFNTYIEFKYGDEDNQTVVYQRAQILLEPLVGQAFALQCLGQGEAAEDSYTQVFELMEVNYPGDEFYVRCSLNYSELLCYLEKPLKAIENILSARKKLSNKNNELYASSCTNLATYYAILKRLETALPHAKEGYEIFSKKFGNLNPYTESSFQCYIRILEELGKTEEVEALKTAWDKSRESKKLPKSDTMHKEIGEKLSNALSKGAPEVKSPEEFLEEQKKNLAKNKGSNVDMENPNFSDPEFITAIAPELKTMYEILGKGSEYEADMERFKKDPEYAKQKLESGLVANILSVPTSEFYKPKE